MTITNNTSTRKYVDVVSTLGRKVCTNVVLYEHSTVGMIVRPEYLANRRASMDGVALSYVPGHGGDVWWVRHDIEGETEPRIAVYCTNEFLIVEEE
jgi:hypothetical protein